MINWKVIRQGLNGESFEQIRMYLNEKLKEVAIDPGCEGDLMKDLPDFYRREGKKELLKEFLIHIEKFQELETDPL